MARSRKARSSRKPAEPAPQPSVAYSPAIPKERLLDIDRGALVNLPFRFRSVLGAAEELLHVLSSVREEATAAINSRRPSRKSHPKAGDMDSDVGSYDWQSAANRVRNQLSILETYFGPVHREMELAGTAVQELCDIARSTEKVMLCVRSQKGRWPQRVPASLKHHVDHWKASAQPFDESQKAQLWRNIESHVRNVAAKIAPRLRGTDYASVVDFVDELLNVGGQPRLTEDERAALESWLQLPDNHSLSTKWEKRRIRELLQFHQEDPGASKWSDADLPSQFIKVSKLSKTTFWRYRTSGIIRSRRAGAGMIQVYLPDFDRYRK